MMKRGRTFRARFSRQVHVLLHRSRLLKRTAILLFSLDLMRRKRRIQQKLSWDISKKSIPLPKGNSLSSQVLKRDRLKKAKSLQLSFSVPITGLT